MSGLWLVSYVALWVLFLVTAFALLSVLRNMGELAEALKRLNAPHDTVTLVAGHAAPIVALQAANGALVATTDFRGQPTTVAVISPGCGPCRSFAEALADGMTLTIFPTNTQRVVISTASVDEMKESLSGMIFPPDVTVLFDTSGSAAEQWGARSTPTFITLDADGRYLAHTVGFTPSVMSAAS